MQMILGEKVNTILLDKFKYLSMSLVLLQVIEALVFLLLASRSDHFTMNQPTILRFCVVNLSALLINLFFLGLFVIIEMKSKKVYSLSFIAIIGGLTGVITMLTSRILAFINPFAWMSSLLTISYSRKGDEFIQVLNPINYYTGIIALTLLILSIMYLKNMKSYHLWKD